MSSQLKGNNLHQNTPKFLVFCTIISSLSWASFTHRRCFLNLLPSSTSHLSNPTVTPAASPNSIAEPSTPSSPQKFPQIPKLSRTTTHLLHHRSHTNMPFTLHASPHNSHSTATTTNSKLIFITSSLTIALAVANRVLYKLALVPMKQYPFFLAQLTTFG